jgi:hypothetical protein
MAGLTLESALFSPIVLIALLSVGFASQPASAIALLVLVQLAAASFIELGATISLRAVGFCEPRLLRRPGGSAVLGANGAAVRLFIGCRPPQPRSTSPAARPRYALTTEQVDTLGHLLIERPLPLDGAILFQPCRRPVGALFDDASSYKGSESAMIETRLGVARRHADKAPGRL